MAWQFNTSRHGTLAHPANEHCRRRIPSLWGTAAFFGAGLGAGPELPLDGAMGCSSELVDPTTPLGARYSLRCSEDATGFVYCADPNMPNERPQVRSPLPDLTARVGVHFNHTLPADAFVDKQSDGRLTSSLLTLSVTHALSLIHI